MVNGRVLAGALRCLALASVLTLASWQADSQGAQPFAHKTIAMVCGENEYHTAESLAVFSEKELVPRGARVVWVKASPKEGDCEFKNYEALASADLLVVSVRRRTPPRRMMDLIRAHLDSGKPLVGLRTASHAFDATPPDDAHASWSRFDREILGASYQGHYGNTSAVGPPTCVIPVTNNAGHPLFAGVAPAEFNVTSHLYKYRDLAPTVTVLLEGRVAGRPEVEPVAWVNTAANRRVFYTSLGSPDDFKLPAFQKLLLNGIGWSLEQNSPNTQSAR